MKKHLSFQPFEMSHHDLVLGWLGEPHVTEWYHGEGLENTKRGLRALVKEGSAQFKAWIALYDNQPFGLFMSYDLSYEDRLDPECHHGPWLEETANMVGMDLLIGDVSFLGKGLAKPSIEAFLNDVHGDKDLVFIDPEATNVKAIHVYEKVGFQTIDDFTASWHPVPHLLMRWVRPE